MQEKGSWQSPISVDSTPIRSDAARTDVSMIDPNLKALKATAEATRSKSRENEIMEENGHLADKEDPIEEDPIEDDHIEAPVNEDPIEEAPTGDPVDGGQERLEGMLILIAFNLF